MYGFSRLMMMSLCGTLLAVPAFAAEKYRKTTVVSTTTVSTTVIDSNAMGINMDGHGTIAAAPSEAQAEQAFANARRSFMAVASGGTDTKPGDIVQAPEGIDDKVVGGTPSNIALENIRVVMDVENVTLRDVMANIVKQAASYTGPWTVKWRLQSQNLDLLDERVNLTAEANFGEFCDMLTERVKNMTGTQLFVTAFAGTRVLLVTDTYY